MAPSVRRWLYEGGETFGQTAWLLIIVRSVFRPISHCSTTTEDSNERSQGAEKIIPIIPIAMFALSFKTAQQKHYR
jgi:hypothetical protein